MSINKQKTKGKPSNVCASHGYSCTCHEAHPIGTQPAKKSRTFTKNKKK